MTARLAVPPSAIVVAGVAGSGKSTVGRLLAERLGWEFVDGDDLHSPAAVSRMRRGVPLSDADRRPWLAAVGAAVDARTATGRGVVVACSALKRAHRDVLRAGRPGLLVVFLHAEPESLRRRLRDRTGHFMTERMLASQLAAAEPPDEAEPAVWTVRSDSPAEDVAARLAAGLAARR